MSNFNWPITMIFVYIVALAVAPTAGRPYQISNFGDVTVVRNEGNIRCDKIMCPAGTARCRVTKSKPDPNTDFMVRRNVCFGSNNEVLLEKTTQEPSAQGYTENAVVEVSENGSVTSFNGGNILNGGIGFDTETFNRNIQTQIDQSIQQGFDSVYQNLPKWWHRNNGSNAGFKFPFFWS